MLVWCHESAEEFDPGLPKHLSRLPSAMGEHAEENLFMLIQHLSHIDFLDEQIAKLDAELEDRMRPLKVLAGLFK